VDTVRCVSRRVRTSAWCVFLAGVGLFALSSVTSRAALGNETEAESYRVPLTDRTHLTVEGKHRFVSIKG
jgi:hypothetical protein